MTLCNAICSIISVTFFLRHIFAFAEKREGKYGKFNGLLQLRKPPSTTRSSIVFKDPPVLSKAKHRNATGFIDSFNILNHGWLYEYTYSKDGCNDADLIASKSIVTNVCLSDKDEAGTLSNNDGESYGSIMYTCENGYHRYSRFTDSYCTEEYDDDDYFSDDDYFVVPMDGQCFADSDKVNKERQHGGTYFYRVLCTDSPQHNLLPLLAPAMHRIDIIGEDCSANSNHSIAFLTRSYLLNYCYSFLEYGSYEDYHYSHMVTATEETWFYGTSACDSFADDEGWDPIVHGCSNAFDGSVRDYDDDYYQCGDECHTMRDFIEYSFTNYTNENYPSFAPNYVKPKATGRPSPQPTRRTDNPTRQPVHRPTLPPKASPTRSKRPTRSPTNTPRPTNTPPFSYAPSPRPTYITLAPTTATADQNGWVSTYYYHGTDCSTPSQLVSIKSFNPATCIPQHNSLTEAFAGWYTKLKCEGREVVRGNYSDAGCTHQQNGTVSIGEVDTCYTVHPDQELTYSTYYGDEDIMRFRLHCGGHDSIFDPAGIVGPAVKQSLYLGSSCTDLASEVIYKQGVCFPSALPDQFSYSITYPTVSAYEGNDICEAGHLSAQLTTSTIDTTCSAATNWNKVNADVAAHWALTMKWTVYAGAAPPSQLPTKLNNYRIIPEFVVSAASPMKYWSQVAVSANGSVIAALSSNNGLFVSINRGATWRRATEPEPNGWYSWSHGLAISGDGSTLIALAAQMLQRSTDLGVTWAPCTYFPIAQWDTLALSHDGSTILGSSQYSSAQYPGGVFYSPDGGNYWFPTNITMGQGGRVVVSLDGLNMAIAGSITVFNVTTKSTSTSDSVYVSWDAGATWAQVYVGYVWYNSELVCSADFSVMAVISSVGVHVSRDYGENWDETIEGGLFLIPNLISANLLVKLRDTACTDSGDLCLQRKSGFGQLSVYEKSDSLSPTPAPTNPTRYPSMTPSGNVYDVQPLMVWTQLMDAPDLEWMSLAVSEDGGIVVGGTNRNGVYISINSGVSWHQTNVLPDYYWRRVAVSADGSIICAASDDKLFVSADLGATWTLVFTKYYQSYFALDMSADGSLIALTSLNKVYVSADSGITWAESLVVTVPNRYNYDIVGVAVSGNGRVLAAVPARGDLYVSVDAGVEWRATTAPSNRWYSSVDLSYDGKVMIAQYTGRIILSFNSGHSWSQRTPPNDNYERVSVSADGKFICMTSANRVYSSQNNGLVWTTSTFEGSQSYYWTNVALFGRSGVAAYAISGQRLFKSVPFEINSKLTPSARPTQSPPPVQNNSTLVEIPVFSFHSNANDPAAKNLAVSENGQIMLVSGSIGVLMTHNGGESWENGVDSAGDWSTNTQCGAVAMSSNGQRMFAACSKTLYFSSNSGTLWSSYLAPVDELFTDIKCAKNCAILYATTGTDYYYHSVGGVYVSFDNAASWAKLPLISKYYKQFAKVSCSSFGDIVAVAAVDGPVFVSHDYGDSWSEKSELKDALSYPKVHNLGPMTWSMLSVSHDGRVIIVAAYHSNYTPLLTLVSVSRDYGVTFDGAQPQITGVQRTSADMTSSDNVVFLSGSRNLLAMSTSDGADFIDLYLPNTVSGDNYQTILVAGQFVYVLSATGKIYRANIAENKVPSMSPTTRPTLTALPTYNANANITLFRKEHIDNSLHSPSFSRVDASDSGQVIVVTPSSTASDKHSYISRSGGRKWNKLNQLSCSDVCVSTDGTSVTMLCGSVVYVSVDNGWNWAAVSDDIQAFSAIACSHDTSTIVAISNGRLYMTFDRGESWYTQSMRFSVGLTVPTCSVDCSTIVIAANKLYYYAQMEGLVVSHDKGESWQFLSHILTDTWSAFSISGNGNVVAAIQNGEGPVVSIDGGDTFRVMFSWNYLPGANTIVLSHNGARILVAGSGGMAVSRDFGSTWKFINEDGINSAEWTGLAGRHDLSIVTAVSRNGQVFQTVNTTFPLGTSGPVGQPTLSPSMKPTTGDRTSKPTPWPSVYKTKPPHAKPTLQPTFATISPTLVPVPLPTRRPSTRQPTRPTPQPMTRTSRTPTLKATTKVSPAPSVSATPSTVVPSMSPSTLSSNSPTTSQTVPPSCVPSQSPTKAPANSDSVAPSPVPSQSPTKAPANSDSAAPSPVPSQSPTKAPANSDSAAPSPVPSQSPTKAPANSDSAAPSPVPTQSPTKAPADSGSSAPSPVPSTKSSASPSKGPSTSPSCNPSRTPTFSPSEAPREVQFGASISLGGMPSDKLTEYDKRVIERSMAETMGVNASNVNVTSYEATPTEERRRLQTAQHMRGASVVLYLITANTTTKVTFSSETTGTQIFESLKALLMDSVSSGNFVETLVAVNQALAQELNITVSAVFSPNMTTAVTVHAPTTVNPAVSDSGGGSDGGFPIGAIIAIAVVGAVVLFLVVFYFARQRSASAEVTTVSPAKTHQTAVGTTNGANNVAVVPSRTDSIAL